MFLQKLTQRIFRLADFGILLQTMLLADKFARGLQGHNVTVLLCTNFRHSLSMPTNRGFLRMIQGLSSSLK